MTPQRLVFCYVPEGALWMSQVSVIKPTRRTRVGRIWETSARPLTAVTSRPRLGGSERGWDTKHAFIFRPKSSPHGRPALCYSAGKLRGGDKRCQMRVWGAVGK